MTDMDKNTAEIIERITTEREAIRHKLKQKEEYILMLEEKLYKTTIENATYEMTIEQLEATIAEIKK